MLWGSGFIAGGEKRPLPLGIPAPICWRERNPKAPTAKRWHVIAGTAVPEWFRRGESSPFRNANSRRFRRLKDQAHASQPRFRFQELRNINRSHLDTSLLQCADSFPESTVHANRSIDQQGIRRHPFLCRHLDDFIL